MKLSNSNFSDESLVEDLTRWSVAYLAQLKDLSYQKNTIILYTRVINDFLEFSRGFDDEMTIRDIKSTFITSYLSYAENISAKQKRIKSSFEKTTKEKYLQILKSFFSFISDENDEFFTFERIFKKIKIKGKKDKTEKISYLENFEKEKLLKHLDEEIQKKNNYNAYRNSLLVKLMLYAGARTSEALGVRLCDIEDKENNYNIHITGKGGIKEQIIIQKSKILKEIEYMKGHDKLKTKMFIFQTRSGRQMTRTLCYEMIVKMFKKLSIFGRSNHSLRHTFAMSLCAKNVDILVVSKLMRHTDVKTTMTYAKVLKEQELEAISRL